jgi:lipid-A-disaccharide synthase
LKREVMIVAGEVSGDHHAAELVRRVRERDPEVTFWGCGGDRLAGQGVEILHHVRELAVMGLVEVLRRYPYFRRVYRDLLARAAARRPDLVVLVDYPGLNLRLAAALHEMGLRVIFYICPQVWAWKRGRIRRMAETLDRLLVIFPFEVEVFAGTGLRVDYVGHPLVDRAESFLRSLPSPLPWPGRRKVALLPGSRMQEIDRILPLLLRAAASLQQRDRNVGFLVAAASTECEARIRAVLAREGERDLAVEVVTHAAWEILRQAEAAMVASGTATLDAALMGCPLIVVYRLHPLTYAIGRRVVKIPHIGMVNIVAGRAIAREFIQDAAIPEEMAHQVYRLMYDERVRDQAREDLAAVRARLRDGADPDKAAAIVAAELNRSGVQPLSLGLDDAPRP